MKNPCNTRKFARGENLAAVRRKQVLKVHTKYPANRQKRVERRVCGFVGSLHALFESLIRVARESCRESYVFLRKILALANPRDVVPQFDGERFPPFGMFASCHG